MNVRLPPEQQKWLEQQVAAGRFRSVEDAVAVAIAGLIVTETDDLAWAKPYVDEAREAASRGDVVPLEVSVPTLGRCTRQRPARSALGPRTRIAIVLPYIVIYDCQDDFVTVLRVLHGKRNITRDLVR